MNFRSLLCAALLALPLLAAAAASAGIAWREYSPQVFEQARAQNKFVFLYLEAVWCHWCHVMQVETFSDAAVQAALARDYLMVRADHDANPLLANRYRDYGWPALVFFAPDGTELVKRAGYIAPEPFVRLLRAVRADPTPEMQVEQMPAPAATALDASLRRTLEDKYRRTHDARMGGLRTAQKFLDRDSVEYALSLSAQKTDRRRAAQTLDAARALIDPVWGGVYQYSTGGGWRQPHYEKIMRTQAGYLRIYALAYAQLSRAADLASAQAIRDYLFRFLRSPQGAFYVSQDADLIKGRKAHDFFALDDAGRRRLGMPAIDRSLYSDANGAAAEALAILYEASGDETALAAARAAVDWVQTHLRTADGGYRHGERVDGGPYLADTLNIGRACLQLYRVQARRADLQCALSAADFIAAHFRAAAGWNTAAPQPGPVQPRPVTEENVQAARFFNLLRHYGGRAQDAERARHALRLLSAPALIEAAYTEPGILLADAELASDPPHFTVVGAKQDPAAAALFAAALRAPGAYKRLEWWDRTEGPLPNTDVTYPALDRAAGYVCADGRCSRPSFEPGDYAGQIQKLTRR